MSAPQQELRPSRSTHPGRGGHIQGRGGGNERHPIQRLAVRADEPQIATLMRASVIELFPRFYDERQTRSAAQYIAHLDRSLIDDGTYFVHEIDAEIVACGGWSNRDRLYTGSATAGEDDRLLDPATEPARIRAMFVRSDWTRRGLGRAILVSCERAAHIAGFRTLALMATLPGVPLYVSFGFTVVERTTVTMPDGVTIDAMTMQRPVGPPTGTPPQRTETSTR